MRKSLKLEPIKFRAYFSAHFFAEQGQAVVEYILMVVVAMSIVALISSTFKRSIIKLWGYYTQQISAACPGCPPDPRYKMR